MKKIKKTNLPQLTKGLIGNYHHSFNIEYAKPVLEKGLIVNSLLGELPTVTKQSVANGVLHASLYKYPSLI